MSQMDYNMIVIAIATAQLAPLLAGENPPLSHADAVDAVKRALAVYADVTDPLKWTELIMSLRPGD